MQRTGSARKPRLECFHIFLHVTHLMENGATFYETVGITLTEPKMFSNGFNTAQNSSLDALLYLLKPCVFPVSPDLHYHSPKIRLYSVEFIVEEWQQTD